MAPNEGVQYVGFWARVGAALIDSALILAIIAPLLTGSSARHTSLPARLAVSGALWSDSS